LLAYLLPIESLEYTIAGYSIVFVDGG